MLDAQHRLRMQKLTLFASIRSLYSSSKSSERDFLLFVMITSGSRKDWLVPSCYHSSREETVKRAGGVFSTAISRFFTLQVHRLLFVCEAEKAGNFLLLPARTSQQKTNVAHAGGEDSICHVGDFLPIPRQRSSSQPSERGYPRS